MLWVGGIIDDNGSVSAEIAQMLYSNENLPIYDQTQHVTRASGCSVPVHYSPMDMKFQTFPNCDGGADFGGYYYYSKITAADDMTDNLVDTSGIAMSPPVTKQSEVAYSRDRSKEAEPNSIIDRYSSPIFDESDVCSESQKITHSAALKVMTQESVRISPSDSDFGDNDKISPIRSEQENGQRTLCVPEIVSPLGGNNDSLETIGDDNMADFHDSTEQQTCRTNDHIRTTEVVATNSIPIDDSKANTPKFPHENLISELSTRSTEIDERARHNSIGPLSDEPNSISQRPTLKRTNLEGKHE
jgi:hypothetical protein